MLNTLCDKKGFSGKKRFLNFSDHNFGDVKYLYFLCLGMFSFWVLLRACFGFGTLRATLAHVIWLYRTVS